MATGLIAATGAGFLLLRRRRRGPGPDRAVLTDPPLNRPPGEQLAIEAELQEMIAEHKLADTERHARAGPKSSA